MFGSGPRSLEEGSLEVVGWIECLALGGVCALAGGSGLVGGAVAGIDGSVALVLSCFRGCCGERAADGCSSLLVSGVVRVLAFHALLHGVDHVCS